MRILSLPVDSGGCGHYRIRQPFSMVKAYTDSDAYVISDKDDMVAVSKAIGMADVLMCRPGSEEGLRQILEVYRKQGIDIRWGMDIDDNTEAISPYSYHYKEYGQEEFYDNNLKKWLWKHGESEFDLNRNRKRMADLIWGLRNAHFVTVTTKRLAKYVKKYNKNVKVLPNCLNLDNWWKLPFKKNEKPRIGWAGGVSHYEDIYTIREPLNKIMREFDATFVSIGSAYGGLFDEDNKHRLEIHPWVPFKGHSFHMMCMNLDFAIIPLANLPFNHYKSSVKWYEMSAMGIPSIVSNVPPYSDEVEHGKTGFLYSDEQQAYEYMKMLILEPEKGEVIANNARKWVEDNRDAQKCAKMWVEAYGH
jgi:glycosyltransferase involved in cell wall biosynthesis